MAISPHFWTSLPWSLFGWKVFSVSYHILTHSKTLLGAIYALSRHLYSAGGVQNMGIFGSKLDYYGTLSNKKKVFFLEFFPNVRP